jgi:alpha-tubulin suppressor-like RCC1 family protein
MSARAGRTVVAARRQRFSRRDGGCLLPPLVAVLAMSCNQIIGLERGTLRRELGDDCSAAGDCASDHCVDGVCCDVPCAGTCEACAPALHGQRGHAGRCRPVAKGTDPGEECGAASCSGGRSCLALAIASGADHACALLGGGTVRCWGDNGSGQLGRSETAVSAVLGIVGATAVACGEDWSCALVTDGEAVCWGNNLHGQLGDPSGALASYDPVTVPGLAGATAIAAGADHTCALLADRTVSCWGNNFYGQVGDGTIGVGPVSPTRVKDLPAADAIVAGSGRTCARALNEDLHCWGKGFGDAAPASNPGRVLLPSVKVLAAGTDHACAAVDEARLVVCWGLNDSGQLGTDDPATTPTPVKGMFATAVVSLAAGREHSCAVYPDQTARCWGSNDASQLGTDVNEDLVVPSLTVKGLEGVTALAAGHRHTCGMLASGEVACWGQGQGNPSMSPTATLIAW